MLSANPVHADVMEAVRTDPARIAAVHATGLLDSEAEEVFDRLTRIAVRILRVPAAFISLVDTERDFYKSACGFGEPLASTRELTGRTFCHYTTLQTTPLVIPDTAADPVYRDVPTVETLGVAAYVGVPLVIDGRVVGAFCAIDMKPHAWTEDEVEVLVELAASAQREMELRSAISGLEQRTEDAEAANNAKRQFLGMMSHELRTPLNAIIGYADLLGMGMRGPVTADQKEFLDRIERASRHLQTLIGDILEFARLDAGDVSYDMMDVSISAAIQEAAELVHPQVTERGITFTHDNDTKATDHQQRVRADANRLRQILVNLLTNAMKFTPMGGHVSIKYRDEGDTFYFSVSDTGRGIPADRLAGIFDPFVQVDRQQTATADQGVGLGLAICRQLARGMHGELDVVSEVGVGSTFTLSLPAATPPRTTSQTDSRP